MSYEVELTGPQTEFFTSQARFPAFVGGFGSGKTYSLITKALALKFAYPDVDGFLGAPTYTLVRDIFFPLLAELLDQMPVKWKINRAENVLYIEGYGKIIMRTFDRPERLVGFSIGWAGLDELDTLTDYGATQTWQKIIARIRQKSKLPGFINQCFVSTTPEGFRFVYRMWGKEQREGYHLVKAPTRSNPHLPDGYIASLMATYPEHLVHAYLDGEFVNLTSGKVYFNFSREHNTHSRFFSREHKLPTVLAGIDFNVYNTAVLCGFQENGNLYICQEYIEVKDTPTALEYVGNDQLNYGDTVTFFPDASGRHTSSTNANESDIRLIHAKKWARINAPSKNPYIENRVAAVNAGFCNALGERRVFIHESFCPRLTEALEQQVYDNNGKPDKTSGLDHPLDAFGYLVHRLYPVGDVPTLGRVSLVGI